MNVIEVDVGKTKLFSIGQQYNNNALVIHFVNLPNQKNKYIYYKIDDIEEEIPLVSDLFIVSRPLMMHSGEVKAQIITRDENNSTIELTKNFTMRIQPSNYSGIGEDENYPDDPNIKNYYVKIDGKIQSMDELIALVQSKLDNGEFVGAQGPKGDPGEKGDPGDVTDEYRNLASQIAQNASDAQTSATNAQTSATNAQKALDDTKEFVNQTKTELNQIKTDTSLLKDEANTSAVNAKASETKAKEYADNLQASTDDISQLKEDLGELEEEIYTKSENLLSIENMSDGYLNRGILIPTVGTYKTTEYIDVSGIESVNLSNWLDSAFGTQAKTIRFGAYYTDTNESSFISQDGSNLSALTIPSNAKYARFTISNDYLVNKPMLVVGTEKPNKYLSHDNSLVINKNALFSKSAVFFGDSVCYGDFWRETENLVYPKNNTGWAYMLRDRNNMQVYGYGNSGAIYPVIPDYNNNIVSQYLSFRYSAVSNGYEPDYIIFEGGINDTYKEVEKGTISNTYTQPSVYNTEYSALEYIFHNVKTTFQNTKVGVIIPHHASGYAFQPKLKEYIAIIKECCEKWSIPYCDLYTQCQINGCIESIRNLYFDEWGVHPNKAGYEIMTDVIEKWMLTL